MHLLLTGLCCTSSMTPLSLQNDINKDTYLNYITFIFQEFGLVEFLQFFFEITKNGNSPDY